MPKLIKIDKSIKDTAKKTVVVLGILGGAAVALVLFYRILQNHSSTNAYAGLTAEEIDATAAAWDKRCNILTRVAKDLGNGKVRYRGIYNGGEGGACAYPIYYHYIPGENFEVYPMLNEKYHKNKDLIDFVYGTGKMVYP